MRVAAAADIREPLRDLVPDGWEVVGLEAAGPGIEAAVPRSRDFDGLDRMTDLRLVQVMSAGTDWIEDLVPDGVTLCNARGARDAAMAEWVLAAVLGWSTGLLGAVRAGPGWIPGAVDELAGKTVVILGMGSIGRACAARLEAFGMQVEGVGRARLGELPALLPAADVVLSLTPLTEATHEQIDAAFLSSLRDGTLVVNAGRGGTVDTDALVAELSTGRLSAVLDVTEPEPLPDDHPLWRAKGLLGLTSHWAGDSPQADARALQLVAEQLGRLERGEALVNVVGGG